MSNRMILEGVVTTTNEDGTTNIAPMGPAVDTSMSNLILRPFQTSTTYRNLKRTGEGVFHVTDDVELLARAAVRAIDPRPPLMEAAVVRGRVLSDSCRWYEFRIQSSDDRLPRAVMSCKVVHWERRRDFLGFNRAKHAVIEAAILATRTHLLSAEEIAQRYHQLAILVHKTAGPQERRAFDYLRDYVARTFATPDSSSD